MIDQTKRLSRSMHEARGERRDATFIMIPASACWSCLVTRCLQPTALPPVFLGPRVVSRTVRTP